jgi:hypothetical protein
VKADSTRDPGSESERAAPVSSPGAGNDPDTPSKQLGDAVLHRLGSRAESQPTDDIVAIGWRPRSAFALRTMDV